MTRRNLLFRKPNPVARGMLFRKQQERAIHREEGSMNNIFYIIGVVVVVLFILGYLGFR